MRTLLALTVLALSNAAFATDAKIYPGVNCYPTSGSTDIAYAHGAILNTGSSAMIVHCPIVTDNTSTTSLYDADVYVLDRSGSASVSCTVYAVEVSTQDSESSTGSSSGSSADPMQVDIGEVGTGVPSTLYITCNIPAVYGYSSSGILGYRIEEN